MENQNALTSTAMLASIWEREQKDTIELILPFVKYALGKTTSIGNTVDISGVSNFISEKFGFHEIPHSVLDKCFTRLTKRHMINKKSRQMVLTGDLSDFCINVDLQLNQTETQTEAVIGALANYLYEKKDRVFKKDMSYEEIRDHFVRFLEVNGYIVYSDMSKLKVISNEDGIINYHIANFIKKEYDKKSKLFTYVDNIVKGLLLSHIVYGYADMDYREKFRDTCFYLDTAFLLRVFKFKSDEENTAASQLFDILCNTRIPVKCFKHNYIEVYKIIEAYRHNICDPSGKYGQTLEHFDKLSYSPTDMDRVLLSLEDYFEDNEIEIVDTPSLSSDSSGRVLETDYASVIGDNKLKAYLSKNILYRNDDALDNDVVSISSIFSLRRGVPIKKIEQCKALFVTTNKKLSYFTQKYTNEFVNNTNGATPLVIDDIELTTLLWLKNGKRYSDLPTLKLIETAQLALAMTEQIRVEYLNQINQLRSEPNVTDEKAAAYRLLIYTKAEKMMEVIDGDPKNIKSIQSDTLEQLARQQYAPELSDKISKLEKKIESLEKVKLRQVNEKVDNAGRVLKLILKFITYAIIVILFTFGVTGLLTQGLTSFTSIILLVFSVFGFIDVIIPRMHYVDRLITIFVNKRKSQVMNQQLEKNQNFQNELEL